MRRNSKVIYSALIALVLLISVILMFWCIEKLINRRNSADDSLYSDTGNNSVFYNGELYSPNNYLDSILFIGVDAGDQIIGESYAQADFLALLVIDNLDKSYQILHINRDTMTDITELDSRDQKEGTFTGQIALAHAYGSNGEMQCINTVAAVQNLLYDININHYVSLTMDAIPLINDGVGGVTLILDEDFTVLGDEFLKGAQVTLEGDQALTFVRWRSNDELNSNVERMSRQRKYITAISEKYLDNTDDVDLDSMLDINEHIVSDCSISQISYFIELLKDYKYEGIITLEGEACKNNTYVEYHIDEEAAQATVIDLFYKLSDN